MEVDPNIFQNMWPSLEALGVIFRGMSAADLR